MIGSRKAYAAGLGVALILGAGFLGDVQGQEPSGKSASGKKKSDPSRRVPPLFGDIGLTSEQKEKIYSIRAKHAGKIAELQRQIDDLEAQSLKECETVLTSTQKKMLEDRRKIDKEQSEERASKKKSSKASK